MAVIPGSIRATGFFAPSDSTDTYAVTDSIYGRGSWREAANTTERDAITTDRRREGMAVYVGRRRQLAQWIQCTDADNCAVESTA